MNRNRRFLLTCAFGLLAFSLRASAQSEAVFGSDGEVYITRADTFGNLFPGLAGVEPSHSVLALEVQYPGAPVKRFLVPETAGSEVERASSLLFEEASHTLFMAWEAWDDYPALKLSGFDGTAWSDPVTVIGNPWAVKTSPQLSITHDSYVAPGETTPRDRTFLHLVWEEQSGAGQHETYYSPVLFENGAFSGAQPPVFHLADFDDSKTASAALPAGLIPISRLVPGKHSQSLVVAFASSETNRLVNLEIDVLPEQLGRLSEEARMHIIDLGARNSYPSGYRKVAELARMHIIDLGNKGFQTEVAQAMAQQVSDLILANKGADKIDRLADQARMHIIDLGAKLSDRGLRTVNSASTSSIQTVPGLLSLAAPARSPHLLSFRMAASWPLPAETEEGLLVRFFPAKSGNALLIAWVENDRVRYRETQGEGWSAPKAIALSGAVDLSRAYEILSERMSQR